MPHQTGKEMNSVCAGKDRVGDRNNAYSQCHPHSSSRQYADTIEWVVCTGRYKRKEIQRVMQEGVAVHQDQIRKQQVVTMM